jgi:uncharacterized protein (TIGR00369 family)
VDGLTFVREMRDSGAHYPPIGNLVGFTILDVNLGKIRISGRPTAQHYNPFGVVHGGFASTLLDLALGHVSVTVLAAMDKFVSTTDLSVKYLRPLFASIEQVFCEAEVLRVGRQIIVAEAKLVDASNKLYATAQSTCLIVPWESKSNFI